MPPFSRQLALGRALIFSLASRAVAEKQNASDGDQVGGSLGYSTTDKYLIAHAVCASFALALFAPMAVLIARFFRGSAWYPSHAALNYLSGVLLIVGVALAIHTISAHHFEETHQRLGIIVFILAIVQILLGAFAHSRPANPTPNGRLPTLSKKSPFRLLHILLGVGILGLGWVTINEGFDTWEEASDAGTPVPMAVKIVFYVVIAVFTTGYVAGWVLEAMGGNRSRKTDDGERQVEKLALRSI